ncbi:hypothetical protein DPMN_156104 [Dreissena polymorpha]|uniref:Uncharacterized protein n=1 Tax=Dreissena polymorpha TaxID=45954 RepID=A0A9D4JBJ0_DREPO|nr:hypothetical protein DPMN_156104 [Dreissena polymorpha]
MPFPRRKAEASMRVTKALDKKRQECQKMQAKHLELIQKYNTKLNMRAIQRIKIRLQRYLDHHYVTKHFDTVSTQRYEFCF